jgi:uncharacterized membrane protein YphA (DoxX/SURF4 family)
MRTITIKDHSRNYDNLKTASGKVALVLGRVFFSLIFIMTLMGHFSKEMIKYATTKGVPYAEYLVPASGIIAALGGLSIIKYIYAWRSYIYQLYGRWPT